jgi:hypothetical protein
MGTTSFRVEGLSGLLAEKATVAVKYSSSDLERAGGDASRLVLARWDEGKNEWSIMKTKVDTASSMLNASTDRFSIWAVMAGSARGGGMSAIQFTLIAGVAAVCMGIVFLFSKMRKS